MTLTCSHCSRLYDSILNILHNSENHCPSCFSSTHGMDTYLSARETLETAGGYESGPPTIETAFAPTTTTTQPETQTEEEEEAEETQTEEEEEAEETHQECARCGGLFPDDELKELNNGELYCAECSDEMTTCDCCGCIVDRDEVTYVEDEEEVICDNCIRANYTLCDGCGNYYRNGNITRVDTADLCPHCLGENYFQCDECGSLTLNEDAQAYDDDDRCFCPTCWRERNGTILPYHSDDRPDIKFFRSQNDAPNALYFGVELEIDCGGCDNDKADAILSELGAEHAFAERDGSLDAGFEIVSQPFTLRYYTETLSDYYAAAMEEATALGYHSHDTSTCGLHVHVGRKELGTTPDEQDDTITKIWLLLYRFPQQWTKLSRRSNGNLARWANLPGLEDLGNMDHAQLQSSSLPELKLKLKNNGKSCRYKALNLTNSNTIEFRLFRGTLKHSTLTATIQLVHNLCAVAMALNSSDALTITWAQLHTLLTVDAPELRAYMDARL